MKIFLAMCVVCLLLLSWLPGTSGSTQEIKLQKAGKVQMLNLQSSDSRPFFRVTLNFVNKDGSPAQITLPGGNNNLKELIEISVDGGKPFHPFYVSSPDSNQAPIGREMMVLFDTSGSMTKSLPGENRNRFDAAKDAAKLLLKDFRDKIDSISIVKFDSHDVIRTIEDAEFVSTKAGAEAQIARLPFPKGNPALYNTALYDATQTALTVLEKRRKSTSEGQRNFLLIILTDGINELKPGDDPELLSKNTDLKTVAEKAEAVDIPVYTIGLGKAGEDYNESALKELAHPRDNFREASNAEKLFKSFQGVEQSSHAFVVTFSDKAHSDSGRLKGLEFIVTLKHPDGRSIKSDVITWSCGAHTGCPPDNQLSKEEREALVNSSPDIIPPPPNPWSDILRLLIMVALLSGGMAFLWFIPPRFMWPRPQIPHIPGSVGAVNLPRNLRPPRETAMPPTPEAPSERRENLRPGARNRLDKTRVIKREEPRD